MSASRKRARDGASAEEPAVEKKRAVDAVQVYSDSSDSEAVGPAIPAIAASSDSDSGDVGPAIPAPGDASSDSDSDVGPAIPQDLERSQTSGWDVVDVTGVIGPLEEQMASVPSVAARMPHAALYERSYMHRKYLTHSLVTPHTHFLFTASVDGVVKLWKKHNRAVSRGRLSAGGARKDQPNGGIEFVKLFQSHLNAVTGMCASPDGRYVATISAAVPGEDIAGVYRKLVRSTDPVPSFPQGAVLPVPLDSDADDASQTFPACLNVFDVVGLTIFRSVPLWFHPQCCEFAYDSHTQLPQIVLTERFSARVHVLKLTVGSTRATRARDSVKDGELVTLGGAHHDEESAEVKSESKASEVSVEVIDGTRVSTQRVLGAEIRTCETLHRSPVHIVRYNAVSRTCISCDRLGNIEYWDPQSFAFPKGQAGARIRFTSKTATSLYAFRLAKAFPLSLSINAQGSLFAAFGSDGVVRVFKFSTGKLVRVYDESPSVYEKLLRDSLFSESPAIPRLTQFFPDVTESSDPRLLAACRRKVLARFTAVYRMYAYAQLVEMDPTVFGMRMAREKEVWIQWRRAAAEDAFIRRVFMKSPPHTPQEGKDADKTAHIVAARCTTDALRMHHMQSCLPWPAENEYGLDLPGTRKASYVHKASKTPVRAPPPQMCWNDTGKVLCFPCFAGIKVVNLEDAAVAVDATRYTQYQRQAQGLPALQKSSHPDPKGKHAPLRALVSMPAVLFAKQENTHRFCGLALFQGLATDVHGTSSMSSRLKAGMIKASASDGRGNTTNAKTDTPTSGLAGIMPEEDPTLFGLAYKSKRFFMFTQRLPAEEKSVLQPDGTYRTTGGRDIFNEKPEDHMIVGAGAGDSAAPAASEVTLHTNVGDIVLKLHVKDTPKTCQNFIGLARKGYYDSVIFHRVIKGFMIQSGDPEGNGTGGESLWGGEFEDEIVPALRHDRPGVLSMANRGPATNGSQFFITCVPTPHLDNKHTVFGVVTKGMDVVHAIENSNTDKRGRPFDKIFIGSTTVR